MAAADAFTQKVVEKKPSFDVQRTRTWALAGLLIHGPYFFLGFRKVDQYFAVKLVSLEVVAKKTAIAQFVLFPPYLVALFAYLGWMENAPIQTKIRHCVPKAF